MERDDSSFWTDIKRYEDILAKEPASYCFTHLSELYRKAQLYDDAIAVAQRGIAVHPDYAGGYLALGRSCHDKGLKKESREALERVVRVTPENIMAQRLLSHLYMEAGDTPRAIATFKTLLYLDRSDGDSRSALDSLARMAEPAPAEAAKAPDTVMSTAESAFNALLDDDSGGEVVELDELEIIEELEIVEDEEEVGFSGFLEPTVEPVADSAVEAVAEPFVEPAAESVVEPDAEFAFEPIVEPGVESSVEPAIESVVEPASEFAFEPVAEPVVEAVVEAPVEAPSGSVDAFSTSTLAELYISQGFLKRALKVYRDILEQNPDSVDLREKIMQLKSRIDADEDQARATALDTFMAEQAGPGMEADFTEDRSTEDEGRAHSALEAAAILEGWLANIRRVRHGIS
jgi:tetratricopeptide (TPR) repeat protein